MDWFLVPSIRYKTVSFHSPQPISERSFQHRRGIIVIFGYSLFFLGEREWTHVLLEFTATTLVLNLWISNNQYCAHTYLWKCQLVNKILLTLSLHLYIMTTCLNLAMEGVDLRVKSVGSVGGFVGRRIVTETRNGQNSHSRTKILLNLWPVIKKANSTGGTNWVKSLNAFGRKMIKIQAFIGRSKILLAILGSLRGFF